MRTLVLLAVSISAAPLLAQNPVDLNTWTAESYPAVSGFGAGVWNVTPTGSQVVQTVNGQPTLFYSDFNAFNTEVEGSIEVTGGDDDYIGFAIGYQPGNSSNPSADYLLIDWKRGTQSFDFGTPACTPSSVAPAGLAVSRVFGVPTADEFWGHTNFDAVCSDLNSGLTELQRGMNLGSTGWTLGQDYLFKFEFSATQLRVFVNGTLELDISGTFSNGRMAFYNFSQAGVTYDAFTLTCPASWENYGAGWPGTLGVPSLTLDALPVQGTTVNFLVGNSLGAPTAGCLLYSYQPDSADVGLGGTVLVGMPIVDQAVHGIAPSGASVPGTVSTKPEVCGLEVYVQLVLIDSGASHGISFSRGLRLVLGE